MSERIDFSVATSSQIEANLGERITRIRLARNMTQTQLAGEAGVTIRTIRRLEKGQGVSLDTLIRVMMALGIQDHLKTMLPDPDVRPLERVRLSGTERRRARPENKPEKEHPWVWGDEKDKPA